VSDTTFSFGGARGTTQTSEVSSLERGKLILWFFETLESQRRDGRLAVQRDVKAHERRFRGDMGPRPEG
jgi:hypothetical protein